jgi:hypothetical protein
MRTIRNDVVNSTMVILQEVQAHNLLKLRLQASIRQGIQP